MLNDVRSHEHGIAEEAVVAEILVGDLLLLFLVGGAAFEPAERGDHGKQQMKFRGFLDVGLAINGAVFGVETGGKPVDDHVVDELRKLGSIGVVAGQSMPVGHEEEGLVGLLHFDPVLEGAEIVTDVKRPGGPHA